MYLVFNLCMYVTNLQHTPTYHHYIVPVVESQVLTLIYVGIERICVDYNNLGY